MDLQSLYFHDHSKIRFVGILMFTNVYLRSYRKEHELRTYNDVTMTHDVDNNDVVLA